MRYIFTGSIEEGVVNAKHEEDLADMRSKMGLSSERRPLAAAPSEPTSGGVLFSVGADTPVSQLTRAPDLGVVDPEAEALMARIKPKRDN